MEDKRTIILNLAAQGMNSSQIARETGFSPGAYTGWNADRKKCRSCRYRARPEQVNRCDYIEHAKHSRGCSVEDCDRYVRGHRLKVMRKSVYKSKI